MISEAEGILRPSRLYARDELSGKSGQPPARPGVYAWFFDAVPPSVPATGCVTFAGNTLLYVGIAPKAPPKNGKPPSSATVRSRVLYHFRGNAEGSTLRLTLGCLLAAELGLALRRVGSGTRMTFTHEGEARLSAWMAAHARVCWVEHTAPWVLEHELIKGVGLPLNLDQNKHHAFHEMLSGTRARAKADARAMPVVVR
jgi:hypothetical protein